MATSTYSYITVAPLPTIWTPPASCASQLPVIRGGDCSTTGCTTWPSDWVTSNFDAWQNFGWWTVGNVQANTECWPPSSQLDNDFTYSPAAGCPVGYTTASSWDDYYDASNLIAICCPQEFDQVSNNAYGAWICQSVLATAQTFEVFAYGKISTYDTLGSASWAYDSISTISTTVITPSFTGYYGPRVSVRAIPMAIPSSLATATSTSAGPTSTSNPTIGSLLSEPRVRRITTIVGIVVGVVFGICIFYCCCIRSCRRRRRRSTSQFSNRPGMYQYNGNSQQPVPPYTAHHTVIEIPTGQPSLPARESGESWQSRRDSSHSEGSIVALRARLEAETAVILQRIKDRREAELRAAEEAKKKEEEAKRIEEQKQIDEKERQERERRAQVRAEQTARAERPRLVSQQASALARDEDLKKRKRKRGEFEKLECLSKYHPSEPVLKHGKLKVRRGPVPDDSLYTQMFDLGPKDSIICRAQERAASNSEMPKQEERQLVAPLQGQEKKGKLQKRHEVAKAEFLSKYHTAESVLDSRKIRIEGGPVEDDSMYGQMFDSGPKDSITCSPPRVAAPATEPAKQVRQEASRPLEQDIPTPRTSKRSSNGRFPVKPSSPVGADFENALSDKSGLRYKAPRLSVPAVKKAASEVPQTDSEDGFPRPSPQSIQASSKPGPKFSAAPTANGASNSASNVSSLALLGRRLAELHAIREVEEARRAALDSAYGDAQTRERGNQANATGATGQTLSGTGALLRRMAEFRAQREAQERAGKMQANQSSSRKEEVEQDDQSSSDSEGTTDWLDAIDFSRPPRVM